MELLGAVQVTDTVAVAILEAARVDLVKDCILPPGSRAGGLSLRGHLRIGSANWRGSPGGEQRQGGRRARRTVKGPESCSWIGPLVITAEPHRQLRNGVGVRPRLPALMSIKTGLSWLGKGMTLGIRL